MEPFPNPQDLFNVSIWERAHKKHLESVEMIGRTCHLSHLKSTNQIFFYCRMNQLVKAKDFLLVRDTQCTLQPRGDLGRTKTLAEASQK